jgi:signal transduction histidine kinase
VAKFFSMPSDSRPNPEREHTDQSLRVEREKVDETLDDDFAKIETAADTVIEKARARADEVLALARATADQTKAPSAVQALKRERVVEDRVIRNERAQADDVVRTERAERVASLESERTETDKDLSLERSQADDAVGTRDDFLAIVSHDLRNMLGVVVGFAKLIAKAESGEDEHRPEEVLMHAQRIQRSGGRMNRLIGDLIDVASIDAGKLQVYPQPTDPAAVALEAVETFHEQALASGIALTMEASSPPTLASIDAARILQVLVNLVSNAIKFTARGGKVGIHYERVGDELRFAVSDTGPGIAPAHLKTIFERYRQIDVDRRGKGLGLYISKCIVEGHGGRIWAESQLGHGSTFRFTLPAAA